MFFYVLFFTGEYSEWELDISMVKNRTGYWYFSVMAVETPMSQENFTNHVPVDKENVS